LKEGVGCGVWGVGKETSFICGGENFFIGTDSQNPFPFARRIVYSGK